MHFCISIKNGEHFFDSLVLFIALFERFACFFLSNLFEFFVEFLRFFYVENCDGIKPVFMELVSMTTSLLKSEFEAN